jgi:hypothetical protein
MTAIDAYRKLLKTAHDALEGTVTGVTPEQATWDPPGKAFSVAANYAHVVGSEDMAVQRLLRGKELLATTIWAGRTGLSELPPLGPGGDLKPWSRQAKIDLPALQRYGQAVYAATDEYVAFSDPGGAGAPARPFRSGGRPAARDVHPERARRQRRDAHGRDLLSEGNAGAEGLSDVMAAATRGGIR